MIVLDASALLELLLRKPAAPAIERRLFFARAALHAPHLIDLEIAQVLRRYVHGGQVSADRGREALDDLGALRLIISPHTTPLASLSPRRSARPSSRATAASPPLPGSGPGWSVSDGDGRVAVIPDSLLG